MYRFEHNYQYYNLHLLQKYFFNHPFNLNYFMHAMHRTEKIFVCCMKIAFNQISQLQKNGNKTMS